MKKQTYKEYAKERLSYVPFSALLGAYALFCLGSLIYFLVIGGWRDVGICFSYVLVVPLFMFCEKNMSVRAPIAYIVFVIAFLVFCLLGASFNFYTYIPILDDILHAAWGITFATLGMTIYKSYVGEPDTTKKFVVMLLFGFGFSMTLSVFWEIFEFVADRIVPTMDMQEDGIISSIHSFMLHDPYDHLNTYQIDGIAYTEIYNEAGELLYTVEGGYLDVGLFDTMWDLIWCTIATTALCVILFVDFKRANILTKHFIPSLYVASVSAPTEETSEAAMEDVMENIAEDTTTE